MQIDAKKNEKSLMRQRTSLSEVILEEGRVAAKIYTFAVKPHWLQCRAPNSPLKVPLPVDRSSNRTIPASSLDPSDLWCQTASGSDPPFFHNPWTDRRTDRQIVHGKVWCQHQLLGYYPSRHTIVSYMLSWLFCTCVCLVVTNKLILIWFDYWPLRL